MLRNLLSSKQYLLVFARHIGEAKCCLQAADRSIIAQCGCLAGDVLGEGDFDVSSVVLARPAIHQSVRLKPVDTPQTSWCAAHGGVRRNLGRDDFPCQRGGHVVITDERPLERAGAVGHRTQIDGVPRQLVCRHLGVNNRVTR